MSSSQTLADKLLVTLGGLDAELFAVHYNAVCACACRAGATRTRRGRCRHRPSEWDGGRSVDLVVRAKPGRVFAADPETRAMSQVVKWVGSMITKSKVRSTSYGGAGA